MIDRDETRGEKNRMDQETAEFYTRVRDAYLAIAKQETPRFRIIDAMRSVEEIHADVAETISKFLE
jgi:dTMP kinase